MKPHIYSLQEHLIPPEKIDSHAYYVIEKLRAAGFLAYLVGGSVRDLLLNVRPKDFDISTSAKPEEIKHLFRSNCILIGRRFRLAHIRFGKKILEVSTFRAGDIESQELVLRDNIWGSPQEDALRRDFTINGLFYDPQTQQIIDYVYGFEDAKKKILRTIGNPRLRFLQDPVRMIRLVKFQARFGFEINAETQNALSQCKEEIKKSSPARVLEELLRMLESGCSKKFFSLLQDHGLLSLLLPRLSSVLEKEKTIFDYLHQADLLSSKHYPHSTDRSILLSCLFFPIFEEKIQRLSEKEKRLHLGLIAEEAKEMLHEFFLPFFHLSRNMKGALISILTHQFRLFPLPPLKLKKIRIPSDPLFPMAMQLFKIRCQLHEELLPFYLQWNEHLVKCHKAHAHDKSYPQKSHVQS